MAVYEAFGIRQCLAGVVPPTMSDNINGLTRVTPSSAGPRILDRRKTDKLRTAAPYTYSMRCMFMSHTRRTVR